MGSARSRWVLLFEPRYISRVRWRLGAIGVDGLLVAVGILIAIGSLGYLASRQSAVAR